MTAALLEAHGVSAGAYVSPHIREWRERVLIHGEPVSEEAFDDAVERAEQSAQVADRAAGEEGPVTQFELLTAAAFVAFAEARVSYAVVEAGLGGRLDATNVIPSKLAVLTSVGLDHTEYLGDTLEEIAAEKLAVLRDHTPLVHGKVAPEVEAVIRRETELKHARPVRPEVEGGEERAGTITPGYQLDNLILAVTAASLVLDGPIRALPEEGISIPGRAQLVPGDPPQIFDAAHNPDGARALAASLPDLAGTQEVVCCIAILDDKDAAGIIRPLAEVCSHLVCTEIAPEQIEGSGRPGGRSHPADALAEIARGFGVEAEAMGDPRKAWARAQDLARERGAVALAAGSHYLLSTIWTERPDLSS